MSSIKIGPTGNIIRGSVLDVAKLPFQRALRDIDPLLYTKWNPKKLRGWGCWEIRRRPATNSIVDVSELDGRLYLQLGPIENDLINHVLDCAFLNYDQIRKLKQMDTWQFGQTGEQGSRKWLDHIEDLERQSAKESYDRAVEARRYAARHHKKELRELRDAVASGANLSRMIADNWEKTGS